MPSKGIGIIYLQRDKFDIYTTLLPNILEFKFVPEIIRDLEIINKDFFGGILKLFIETNNIQPCNMTIVLADNVCFIKDFARAINPVQPPDPQDHKDKHEADKQSDEELEKTIGEFLEHIPFEEVGSKRQDIQNGVRVFASNQEMYESIKSAFELHGFSIDAVIPGAVYNGDIGNLPVLNPAAISEITLASQGMKKYNFLIQPIHAQEKIEIVNESAADKETALSSEPSKPKNDNKRVILLSSVFGFLIIVLVVVYYFSNSAPPTSVSSNASHPVSSVETIK